MFNELAETDRAAGEAFRRMAAAVDEFEGYAHPHAARVARISDELARAFGLSRADRSSLTFAALLHDVGEMAMKRDYIRRAGSLGEEERLDLARHPVIGEQESARLGADRAVQLLVRWHHEWWSGAGYPDALRAEQIPLKARILRVADAYAALTDARPWRPAGTEAEARKHLTLWAGLEFDPAVVRAFLSLAPIPELRSYAREADAAPRAETADDRPPAPPLTPEPQPARSATAEPRPTRPEESRPATVGEPAPATVGEPRRADAPASETFDDERPERAADEAPREPAGVGFGQVPPDLGS